MEHFMVDIEMEFAQDLERFYGIMDKNLKVIGRKELNVDMEYGLLQKMINMKENGYIIDNMDKVFSNIVIVLIKELSKIS
jgi:hypothetical protein